jgi:DNA-binding response OmpR family regulator
MRRTRAAAPAEAKHLAGRNAPRGMDLVVSDIRLPCFSGLEILEGLRLARARAAVLLALRSNGGDVPGTRGVAG